MIVYAVTSYLRTSYQSDWSLREGVVLGIFSSRDAAVSYLLKITSPPSWAVTWEGEFIVGPKFETASLGIKRPCKMLVKGMLYKHIEYRIEEREIDGQQ